METTRQPAKGRERIARAPEKGPESGARRRARPGLTDPLSPVPDQNRKSPEQPRAGCKKRADDFVPQPIGRECGQCEGERGDERQNEQ